jgi:hypothetical protein
MAASEEVPSVPLLPPVPQELAIGLTIPCCTQIVSRRGLTASLCVLDVRGDDQIGLIFGWTGCFMGLGGLTV